MTLLISAIGHDVGHPGVNNMFLVKLNAPLAQLYNDTSVLEAFHCAAYSQILRRHWPSVFHDKAIRKLMISSILATDMGCHSDYMQQLGQLQEKIHESGTTDGWTPKDIDLYRILTCGLIIKCADISNVARPWSVAEKWTYKLQEEFAHQGEMEQNIGMETTLFGGPPEIGNMLKLANGQIGFMTIFAHPLFANVASVIPAMSFAADEILVNKGVWFTRAEHEKQVKVMTKRGGLGDGGVSPRSQSPVDLHSKSHVPASPLRERANLNSEKRNGDSRSSSLQAVAGVSTVQDKEVTRPASQERLVAHSTSALTDSKLSTTNGITEKTDSATATPRQKPVDHGNSPSDSVTAVELNDKRTDGGVSSMRAGSAILPVQQMKESNHDLTTQDAKDALASFKFATSNDDEPTRIFHPGANSEIAHPEARASAPMNDLDHQKVKHDMATARAIVPTIDEESKSRDGANLTPTVSTEANSYTTDNQSEDALSSPQTAHSPRDRTASAPAQRLLPLEQSYSLNSNDSLGNEGGKSDFRTTIFSNGDSASDEKKDRKMSSKTLGNKRSRLKMGLSFWKKRNSDRSLPEESRQVSYGQSSP